jgi:nicotine blue oxidoreductase
MVAGIVLAAGGASRFGAPKQLAELDGVPLIEHAMRAQAGSGAIRRLVVVLGARAELIRAQADLAGADVIVCEAWAEGLSASLRTGLEALPERVGAVLVTLADQPRVTAAAVARVAAAGGTCRAAYDGVPGHPVRLAGAELEAARWLTGDVGARDLLAGARLVECGDLGRPDDVDTPQDLERMRT